MKCWIVPSSSFVSGRIMDPIRLVREREAMEARRAKLEAELAALPGKIAVAEAEQARLVAEYIPFKTMELL